MKLKLTRLIVVLTAILAGTNALAATFTVTTTNDLVAADGVLSFREAISNANATVGSHLIDFAIPPFDNGVKTITPVTSLPGISRSVTIDGYTQDTAQPNTLTNDNNAVLLIELDGSVASGSGLNIAVSNCVVRGLVINRFASSGISVNGSPVDDVVIEGNFIGTDPSGTVAQPNGQGIFAGGPDLTIGGSNPAARNLISGNSGIGIATGGLGITNIVVQGNFIGTDVHGTAPLGNGNIGVFIGTTPNNTIGGTADGAGNVIAANGNQGINITTSGNVIQGNSIGTDVSGTLNLSNHTEGVIIGGGGVNNQIGGAVGNVIGFNGSYGVLIQPTSPLASNNLISANSIFSNAALGINLGSFTDPASGVTSNDLADADDGSNHQQNFPILTAATSTVSSVTIAGLLDSVANRTYTLEFFANSDCDPSGFGEGETFLGSTNVTTGSNHTNVFLVTFPVAVADGLFITATATDPDDNTSEFSPCAVNQGAVDVVACVLAPALETNTVGTAHTVTSTITTNGNPASGVTVNFSIISGPNNGDTDSDVTDAAGHAAFTFTGNSGVGSDIIRAIGTVGSQATTCTATKVWIAIPSTNQPPVAICRNVTNNATANCQAAITATQVDNASNDPDGTITNRTLSPAGPYALGNTVVMLTVTDDDGESDSCSATVRVEDHTAPTVACPGAITTNVAVGVTNAVVQFSSTFGDNCSLTVSNCTPASGSTFPLGTNAVTCLAVDGSGNTNTCTFNVIVRTASPPAPVACSLAPSLDTNTVGAVHTVTSTITTNGNPASGVTVNFSVISGPNNGDTNSDVTDAAGHAEFTYTGDSGAGTDIIRAIGTVGSQATTCTATKVWIATAPAPHDLAIIKMKAPKNINLNAAAPALTQFVVVTIQNRSAHTETITNFTGLVTLVAQSLGTNCPNATVQLRQGPPNIGKTLKPKQKMNVFFDVTYDCVHDPLKGVGHEDFSFSATVNHAALDGNGDTHSACDTCPRPALPGGIDDAAGLNLKDKGCGPKDKATGLVGAVILTDVVEK